MTEISTRKYSLRIYETMIEYASANILNHFERELAKAKWKPSVAQKPQYQFAKVPRVRISMLRTRPRIPIPRSLGGLAVTMKDFDSRHETGARGEIRETE